MPTSFLNGIDVSHYNGAIDWNKAAATGLSFAYVKASEGVHTQDALFGANFAAAKAAGLLRGGYHFFHPASDAVAQANNFIAAMSVSAPGDLPPALDLEIDEGQSASAIAKGAQAWLDAVEQALGKTPMIYTGANFWATHMANTDAFARYPLWVAHYTTRPTPAIPPAFPGYAFWQFSQSGAVDGIKGAVDMDRFNGSLDALKALAGVS